MLSKRMHLVQLFLPQADDTGSPLPATLFSRVRTDLVERFGGLTTYSRAPAKGIWLDSDDEALQDDVVVYEVVVGTLDRAWWSKYVVDLETAFAQQRLHVRALPMELL